MLRGVLVGLLLVGCSAAPVKNECRPPRLVIQEGASLQAIARAEQLVAELVARCERGLR